MIDTIELRFHGILSQKTDTLNIIKSHNTCATNYAVVEHHELYKKMLRHKHKLFSMVKVVSKETETTELLDESDFLQLENTKNKKGFTHIKQVMRFIDEKKVKEMTMRVNGKYSVPSSIAAVVFKINENAGFIDFNVSVPKYLYNHSLAEFVPQIGSEEYFNIKNPESFNAQRKVLYKRFMKFIDRFLKDICDMFKIEKELYFPNKDYIELRRIDLCYNQYFETKADSLNYLNHLRKLTKMKATHANNNLKEYDTSITYFTSSGAYFKIYHKGTEYTSSKFGDLKKHLDFNKMYLDIYYSQFIQGEDYRETTLNEKMFERYRENLKDRNYIQDLFVKQVKGQSINFANEKLRKKANEAKDLIQKIQPFKIHFLKKEMDKVLRYEISLRPEFFSYQYKRKIFRKSDKAYNAMKENYNYVHSVNNSNNPKKPKLTKTELREYRIIDAFYNRSIGMTFSSNPKLKRFLKTSNLDNKGMFEDCNLDTRIYKYTILSEKDVGIFNDEMLQTCINYFKKTMDSFQVNKLQNYDSLAAKIKEYNQETEQRIKEYNIDNRFRILDINGNPKIKGRMILSKATQLLTQKEKFEKKLKPIKPLRIMQILQEMEKGKSLHIIRSELGISKSTFSRLNQDLKMFGIYETTLQLEKDFNPEISYRQYYFNTSGLDYQSKFFFKKSHMKYG